MPKLVRTGQDTRLRDTADAIEEAFKTRSIAELDAVMARAFARFGIKHFSFDQMRAPSGELKGVHHFGRWQLEWGEHYLKEQHFLHDGMIRHALASPSPLRWRIAQDRRGLDPQERRLFGEAAEFGLRDGLVTPVHQLGLGASAVTVVGDAALDLSLADEMAVRMLSLYYCAHGAKLREDERVTFAKVHLTERQRQCLQWAHAGKSSWEIGEILGISENTVTYHIINACKQLGVRTRRQATMEALVRGLISL